MLSDVKKKKKRESRASKALYVQTAVKGRGPTLRSRPQRPRPPATHVGGRWVSGSYR
jgi:hypothetical protein